MSGGGTGKPRQVKRGAILPLEGSTAPGDGRSLAQVHVEEYRKDRAAARVHVDRVLRVFYVLNTAVFVFVVIAWIVDRASASTHPVVTENVLLALIAASTAQLGALAFSVGKGFWSGLG